MKASSDLPSGSIPVSWVLTGVGLLLLSWGYLGNHQEDALSISGLVGLLGVTSAIALLNLILVARMSAAPEVLHLRWIVVASLVSFIMTGAAFANLAFEWENTKAIPGHLAVYWWIERLFCAIAFLQLSTDTSSRQPHLRGPLMFWLTLCVVSISLITLAGKFPYQLSNSIITRPWEFIPGLLWFIATTLLYFRFSPHLSAFGHCLMLFLIINICIQFGYAAFAREMNDSFTRDMVVMRLLAQLVLFWGLSLRLRDLIAINKNQLNQLSQQLEQLQQAQNQRTNTQINDGHQAVSRKVLLSLMEDFHTAREQEADAKHFAESIIENMPMTVFVKDTRELRYQRLNRAGEALFGHPREHFIGKNDYDFFAREMADTFTDMDRKVLAGTEPVDIPEEPIDTPQGRRWMHTRKIPVRNAQGKAIYLLGISEDITEKREFEQRFTLLFDAAPNGLMLVHQNNNIILVNQACCDIFGYRREELVNESIHQLLPERIRGSHSSLMLHYWVDPHTRKMTSKPNLVGIHKDGHEIPLDIALQPLPWQGELFVLAAITDITERQRFVEQLEQTSRYKSLFLANMSHELRTPMNSIIGFTEKVLKAAGNELNQRHQDALETVKRNAHHLLGLINDVLDLSKIEAGKMEVEAVEFDLISQLELVRTEYTQMSKGKGLQFSMQLPTGPLLITTDRRKLLQICHNLMSNAVKYTETGSVKLVITREDHSELGSAIKFTFADTGLGITPEDQKKLFTEFGRAAEVRAKNIQGTGLGLLITAQLVGVLGGRISAESEHGKGSVFTVLLPLNQQPASN